MFYNCAITTISVLVSRVYVRKKSSILLLLHYYLKITKKYYSIYNFSVYVTKIIVMIILLLNFIFLIQKQVESRKSVNHMDQRLSISVSHTMWHCVLLSQSHAPSFITSNNWNTTTFIKQNWATGSKKKKYKKGNRPQQQIVKLTFQQFMPFISVSIVHFFWKSYDLGLERCRIT